MASPYAHLIGGCRMGPGPENSVADTNQRTWAVPNLYLADGSVCPIEGSANPLCGRLAGHRAPPLQAPAGQGGGVAMTAVQSYTSRIHCPALEPAPAARIGRGAGPHPRR